MKITDAANAAKRLHTLRRNTIALLEDSPKGQDMNTASATRESAQRFIEDLALAEEALDVMNHTLTEHQDDAGRLVGLWLQAFAERGELIVTIQHENGQDGMVATAAYFTGAHLAVIVNSSRNAYDFWRGIYERAAAHYCGRCETFFRAHTDKPRCPTCGATEGIQRQPS